VQNKKLILLFVGDIFGEVGRRVASRFIPELRLRHNVDIVVVNGENAAGGRGITPEIARYLFSLGVDIITTGNHVFDQKSIINYFLEEKRILRPANYSPRCPGSGFGLYNIGKLNIQIAVVNLQGRIYMPPTVSCPFLTANEIISKIQPFVPIFIDFHGEASSEKIALGKYLDGRVSAVIGTHTHVQTSDAKVLLGGTAFITDVGMTGPIESVIGMKTDVVIEKFISGMPVKFEPAGGVGIFNGVLIEVNLDTGKSTSIASIIRKEE